MFSQKYQAVFNIEMFLEQQISILEYLKKNQLCHHELHLKCIP